MNIKLTNIVKACGSVMFDNNNNHQMTEQESLTYIETTYNVSRDEAKEIYNELLHEELNKTIDSLVAKGFLEIVEYDETGEPKYGLTDLGKSAISMDNKS